MTALAFAAAALAFAATLYMHRHRPPVCGTAPPRSPRVLASLVCWAAMSLGIAFGIVGLLGLKPQLALGLAMLFAPPVLVAVNVAMRIVWRVTDRRPTDDRP